MIRLTALQVKPANLLVKGEFAHVHGAVHPQVDSGNGSGSFDFNFHFGAKMNALPVLVGDGSFGRDGDEDVLFGHADFVRLLLVGDVNRRYPNALDPPILGL